MTGQSFNLIDRPWIEVLDAQHQRRCVSIRQAFEQADQIRRIAGEIPTQDSAILRLLLAIFYRATWDPDNELDPVDLWKDWWDNGIPLSRISNYLDKYADRFDLLHPVNPFLQVASLSSPSGARSGLGKIIAEIPDGHQFFTARAGSATESLSLAEAARWLVHCQAWDPSGIKTGAVGDERVKGGKGYPFGFAAWSGCCGLITVFGENLRETLLLNCALGKYQGQDDSPFWERPQLTAAQSFDHPMPTGTADLYTWQSRRIRLFVDEDRVVDVQVSNGDKLPPYNLHPLEPMSAWRASPAQQRAKAKEVYLPVTHAPDRAIWRGLASLLIASDNPTTRRPTTLEWLSQMTYENPERYRDWVTRLESVGIAYGSNNSTIDQTIHDRIDVSLTLITRLDLRKVALTELGTADEAVNCFGRLHWYLATAKGVDTDQKIGRLTKGQVIAATGRADGYALIDRQFRDWLGTLTSDSNATEAATRWQKILRTELTNAAEKVCSAAGTIADIGRAPTADSGAYNTATAMSRFSAGLAKATPLAHQDKSQEGTKDE